MNGKLIAIALAVITTSATAFAATDGTLGATSTGTSDVSVNLVAAPEPEIQISDLSDISVPDIEVGSTQVEAQQGTTPCVYSPNPLTYSLEISAPSMTGAVSGETMPYSLGVVGLVNGTPEITSPEFFSGTTIQSVSGLTASQDLSCTDDTVLSVPLIVDPTLAGFPSTPDAYSATITFTVTPE